MPEAPDPPAHPQPSSGWRLAPGSVSLPEVHGTVAVPSGAGFWRKMMAFAGPGYLVAVGYMDPGNWATDLAGGSRYGYTLISVIMLSNLMAILLQALSARLGIVSGRDLAQACRDHFSPPRPPGPRFPRAHGSRSALRRSSPSATWIRATGPPISLPARRTDTCFFRSCCCPA